MKRLFVIGLGPGDERYLTGEAVEALDNSEVIVGYKVYINLLPERYRAKELYATGMGDETGRCIAALDMASQGRDTAVVCGGDAGVYGMASLILELAEGRIREEHKEVDITIIPGITAALSCAARLGAPIGNDFAVVSLSTALTPWEEVENRLICAAKGDFVTVIYNPKSRTRTETLDKACDIMIDCLGGDRISGYVRNMGRDNEVSAICSLRELKDADIDMFTTVFVGNSRTKIIGDKLITGRKYLN